MSAALRVVAWLHCIGAVMMIVYRKDPDTHLKKTKTFTNLIPLNR